MPLAASNIIQALVFSRDRAMQLDAALRSLWLHCLDASRLAVTVLYRATDGLHAGQYAELAHEYRQHPNLCFLPQRHFWRQTLGRLAGCAGLPEDGSSSGREAGAGPAPAGTLRRYCRLLFLGRRFSFMRRPLPRSPEPRFVLFLVDDNLFVRDFYLADACRALDGNPQALGFSLRLGANTTHSYPLDRPQALPNFSPAAPGVLLYDWTVAELDFGYPLEVSSSLYRVSDLLPFLDAQPFANPNQLESRLADHADQFRQRSQLLCFVRSVTFCNPVNTVNPDYQNRAGEEPGYSSRGLAERFAAGERIDVAAYSGFIPNGCHQEAPLNFVRSTAVRSAG